MLRPAQDLADNSVPSSKHKEKREQRTNADKKKRKEKHFVIISEKRKVGRRAKKGEKKEMN